MKMKRTKKRFSSLSCTYNKNVLDINSKITRVSVITLGVYIVLYLPTISCIDIFMPHQYALNMAIIQDASIILYYINNAINPFIYYFTMKDFKDGYKYLLRSKTPNSDHSNTSESESYN